MRGAWRVKVLESFTAAKSGREDDCEDGILVTEHFAAVVDGATDKSGRRYDGLAPGRFAMLACLDAIGSLPPRADAESAIRHLTETLASRLPPGLPPGGDSPTAAAAVYSAARREIWQVGDVGFWHEGMPEGAGRPVKLVDQRAAEIRAAVLRAVLGSGADPAETARADPGRAAIKSILTGQGAFRNNPAAGEWAYAAIDGHPVDPALAVVHPVPDSAAVIILASDGYPAILPDLRSSEALLARLLAEDPLCTGALLGTKGVQPGNQSYDDRSYLRIAV